MINTMGATPVHQPQNMPRNQRAALFADPDGIIHEIFAEII
jgi:lactoylglutathione lyase